MSLLPSNDVLSDLQWPTHEEALLAEEDPYHPLPEEFGGNGHKEIPSDKYLVVMPSIRKIPWEYFEPLKDVDIFVCDDSDGKADRGSLKPGWNTYGVKGMRNIHLANRDFTRSYVGEDNLWLFPNHNPSVKNIGLYFAWKEGYKAVILLDDDCDCRERSERDFFTIGRGVSTWDAGFGADWVNTLDLISNQGHPKRLFARGYPYEYRTYGHSVKKNTILAYPYFNQGLWTGHPDINGMDKLEMYPDYPVDLDTMESDLPWWIDPDFDRVRPGQVRLRVQQKLPLSIMNCQIHTSLIPAFFQPADFDVYNTYKVRRHDDIWSMYILKGLIDKLGLDVTVGEPLVRHRKEGNAIGEALSEHYTNLIQHSLMRLVDQAVDYGYIRYFGDGLMDASVIGQMMKETMLRIRSFGNFAEDAPGEYKPILHEYFRQAQGWAELFI